MYDEYDLTIGENENWTVGDENRREPQTMNDLWRLEREEN